MSGMKNTEPADAVDFKSASGSDKRIINQFLKEVKGFVDWILLAGAGPATHTGRKVIHDPVWGTHRYDEFEVRLIDTPIVQRLRHVHQTAFTYLTYPSTQHTRFEHTLGVTAQMGRLFRALSEKFEHNNTGENKKDLLEDKLRRTLRAAAILHDCGHGFMSHSSEEFYGSHKEIKTLKKYHPFKKASPHEIMSYLIIDSAPFRNFLKQLKDSCNADIDEELLKNAIVGHVATPFDHFKIDMLNGPFDADKLDYLARDGYTSGLPLKIDMDRLWYSLDVNDVGEFKRLTVDWGGVSSLEQIVFSKMTLFPAVYHHQKVRTCDCMLKAILEYIRDNKISLRKNNLNMDFGRAIHSLYFTDAEFFEQLSNKNKNKELQLLLDALRYRRLLKRAIVISFDTVADENQLYEFMKHQKSDPGFYRDLACRIWKAAGEPGLKYQVWVDCPSDVKFDFVDDTWISPLSKGEAPMPLTDFFSMKQYANQYKHRKWRGHVFCRAEDTEIIAKACVKVFKKSPLNMRFKPLAFKLCHLAPPPDLI